MPAAIACAGWALIHVERKWAKRIGENSRYTTDARRQQAAGLPRLIPPPVGGGLGDSCDAREHLGHLDRPRRQRRQEAPQERGRAADRQTPEDRKSTRLNSS